MKICIPVAGAINDGMWSPERSESRWAQNWVRFLSEETDHQIIAVGDPGPISWGVCPPLKNVELICKKDLNHDVDLYIDSCWYPSKQIGNVRAKGYVMVNWGWEDYKYSQPGIIYDLLKKPNYALGYTFLEREREMTHGREFVDKTFLLPIPLAKEFGKSHFDKDEITYTPRDIFLNRQEPNNINWIETGINVIRAITDVAEKYHLKTNFFMAHELSKKSDQAGYVVEKYGIEELISRAPRRSMYEIITLDKLMEVIDRSKVITPVIGPGGSIIEGISAGVMALTWQDLVFPPIARQHDFLLDAGASYPAIRTNLERMLGDRAFYDKMLGLYQHALKDHLYDNCKKHFNKLTEWLGRL